MNFNVEEFSNVITSIVERCNVAERALEKYGQSIDDLRNCIGSEENTALYQGWGEFRDTVESVRAKFSLRKEAFIDELLKYKEQVILNNDQIYKDVMKAKSYIESIASQIEAL